MNYILIQFVNLFSQVLSLIIIVDVILAYFMSPYHPVRMTLDRVVEPLLNPIRRIVPLIGMLDFSPFILIILVQLIARLLVTLILLYLR